MYSKRAVTKMQAVLVIVVIVVALIAGFYFYSSTSAPPRPFITFATWGGEYVSAFNTTIASFEQKYGIDVNFYVQSASMETEAKIRAEAPSPSIDLFFGGADVGVTGANQSLFVNLTQAMVPNLSHVSPKFLYANYPSVIPYDLLGEGWYYRPDLMPKDLIPTNSSGSWQWLLDPRLKGKIAVPTPEFSFFIEWASTVAGNYYNYTAGLQLIKQLAPSIKLVYGSTPEIEGVFMGGNVWLVNGLFSDASDIASKGTPIQTLKYYPLIAEPEAMMVVKGGKEAMAEQFLNYILDPTNQYTICTGLGNPPTNQDSPAWPANMTEFSATPLNVVQLSDVAYLSVNAANFVELWEREITPLLP